MTVHKDLCNLLLGIELERWYEDASLFGIGIED